MNTHALHKIVEFTERKKRKLGKIYKCTQDWVRMETSVAIRTLISAPNQEAVLGFWGLHYVMVPLSLASTSACYCSLSTSWHKTFNPQGSVCPCGSDILLPVLGGSSSHRCLITSTVAWGGTSEPSGSLHVSSCSCCFPACLVFLNSQDR